MSILKAETYQGVAYLLDAHGRVWQFKVEDNTPQPEVRLLDRIDRHDIADACNYLGARFGGRR